MIAFSKTRQPLLEQPAEQPGRRMVADTSGLQRLVDEDQDHADQQAATNS